MPDYTLDITRDGRKVGTGDAHRTCTVTAEWLGPGSWQASWPLAHRTARQLVTAAEAGEDLARWGMALRARGEAQAAVGGWVTTLVVASGSVQGYATDSITAYGVTDTAVLARSVAVPDPAVHAAPGTLGTWSVYADGPWSSGEEAILDLVSANMGPAAVASRRHPLLTVPAARTPPPGAATTAAYRLVPLLEAVRAICEAQDLTVRVDRHPGELRLVVDAQRRLDGVRWSQATGSMAGAATSWTAAAATTALVGGKGERTTRVFTRVDQPTAPVGGWGWPREELRDATSKETLAELTEDGAEFLLERTAKRAVAVEASGTSPYAFGRDYRLGDLTPVDVGGITTTRLSTVVRRVEAVTLAHEGASWRETPKVGEPVGDPAAVQRRVLADLRRRGRL